MTETLRYRNTVGSDETSGPFPVLGRDGSSVRSRTLPRRLRRPSLGPPDRTSGVGRSRLNETGPTVTWGGVGVKDKSPCPTMGVASGPEVSAETQNRPQVPSTLKRRCNTHTTLHPSVYFRDPSLDLAEGRSSGWTEH